tara:strand:- start:9 stop:212 length:204 start_codon:yes stop_codon:yes gene_type:complete
MDNIINFPTWIIEKERHLSRLESDLALKKMHIEREEYKINAQKQSMFFKNILSFSIGFLFASFMFLI